MSHELPDRPDPLPAPRRFAIVASRYNSHHVEAMMDAAVAELGIIAKGSEISIVRVPGSFEIPLGVQVIAKRRLADAILTFGVIWEGQTRHADLIANTVTQALMDIMLAHRVPVMHEVLVLQNEEQARERCAPYGKLNRGIEAARAAVRMLTMLDEVAEESNS